MMPPKRCSRSSGVNTWQPCMTPHKLMARVPSQSDIDIAPTGSPPVPIPALLITRSAGCRSQLVATRASSPTCSYEVTSQGTAWALPPPMMSTVSCARPTSISAQTTRPPRAASVCAKARPIPLPAPVTTALAP
ncbi:Uncharacterised protein [Mycobacteroides abscessus subsp. abscessus]|nr:Uncharacterised protein [Mycobacteroides abscessus subsp. abscessus]